MTDNLIEFLSKRLKIDSKKLSTLFEEYNQKVRLNSNYSERGCALQGNTKPYKDVFKPHAFMKFNPRLKGGPGWTFSKDKLEAVKKILEDNEIVYE